MPERVKVGPIGVALDHLGDDVSRCGLLGDNPGEIPQILLGLPNDLGIVEAGLTHGGFYRHFDSLDHLVEEAAQRALRQGSEPTMAAGQLGGRNALAALIDGYLSTRHRDHPESGCGVAGLVADVARADGSLRASFTRQVQVCLDVLRDLIDNPDQQAGQREAVLALSALVGAISMSRAVDDPALSLRILNNAAAALKERLPK